MHPSLRYRQASGNFQVFVKTPEGCTPLPAWAYYYLLLGSYVAGADARMPRLVIGLAVPTRAFAAAFCATGVVAARSLLPVDRLVGEEYLEWLCSLPVGTEIGYAEGATTVPATVRGFDREGDTLYLSLRVRGKRGISYTKLPATALGRIRGVSCVVGSTRDGAASLDRRSYFLSGWCQHLLTGRHRSEFMLASGVQSIILGRLTRLREEITATPFCVRGPDGESALGALQDVLAVEAFNGRRDPARARVIASSSTSGMVTSTFEHHPVVVFDGPAGYLKWRDTWRDFNRIVVLDRSDPSFEAAVEQLNRDFVQRRIEDTIIKGLPVPPLGTEVLAFHEEWR